MWEIHYLGIWFFFNVCFKNYLSIVSIWLHADEIIRKILNESTYLTLTENKQTTVWLCCSVVQNNMGSDMTRGELTSWYFWYLREFLTTHCPCYLSLFSPSNVHKGSLKHRNFHTQIQISVTPCWYRWTRGSTPTWPRLRTSPRYSWL